MTSTPARHVPAPAPAPAPGINNTYDGACVVCYRGTDTGVAFDCDADFAMAALTMLGVPMDQAIATVQRVHATQMNPNKPWAVHLCRRCAARSGSGFEVGLAATGFPMYRPGRRRG